MDQQGWIKLHRKLKEWEWYHKSEMVHLFIHLLLSANHEEGNWQGVTIKRGQLVTGLDSLKKDTGISTQSLRTCITKLKSTGEITSQSTNKFRIITLINYEDYQDKEEKPTIKSIGELTNNQQSINNQLTANKNDKNNKNDKEEEIGGASPYSQNQNYFPCESKETQVGRKCTHLEGQGCEVDCCKKCKTKGGSCRCVNSEDPKETPAEIMKSFLTTPSQQEFKIGYLQGKYPILSTKIIEQQVQKFIAHWSEKNKAGTKQKWELEKTFELDLRLGKWFDNFLKWEKQPGDSRDPGVGPDGLRNTGAPKHEPVIMEFTNCFTWDKTKEVLKGALPTQAYDTWVRPLLLQSEATNYIRIQVPNIIYRDWINKNYRQIIENKKAP